MIELYIKIEKPENIRVDDSTLKWEKNHGIREN